MKKSKFSLIISIICLIVGVLGIVSAFYMIATGNMKFSKVIGAMLLSILLILLGVWDIRTHRKSK